MLQLKDALNYKIYQIKVKVIGKKIGAVVKKVIRVIVVLKKKFQIQKKMKLILLGIIIQMKKQIWIN